MAGRFNLNYWAKLIWVSGALAATQSDQGNAMANPSMLDEDSLKRIILGAVIGGVITAFAGFSGLGWTFENTAKEMAKKSASEAVVGTLAPICADNFHHAGRQTGYCGKRRG
jgi:hypothetical protein